MGHGDNRGGLGVGQAGTRGMGHTCGTPLLETLTRHAGFLHLHTHTQANTPCFYTYIHIHKGWDTKESVAEAAHNGHGQEGKQ